ncbi:MAG: DUF885 domain-containing protein [Massilia sp.]
MRRLCAILVLCAPLAASAGETAADQAQVLFDRDWQWRMQHQPEFATTVGDHRFDARLSDTSLAASREALAHEKRMLDAIRQVDRDQLKGQDRLSYDLFVDDKERKLAAARFYPYDPQPITAQDGIHVRLPQLVAQMPFATETDYRNYIARLDALPRHVDGLVEQMREGMRSGWTAPKAVVGPVPAMLREMRENLVEGALGEPFRRIPATIPKEVRDELAVAGPSALLKSAGPALQKLENFIRTEYLPAARESIAASSLPGGDAWYALLVKAATSSELAPADINALGLKEVARLRAQAQGAIERTGFRGSFAQFVAFARSDPRLFYKDPQALLARYRRTVERARAQLPLLVATIPDEEIVVKPVQQAGAGQQLAAYYQAGTPDTPAALVVNTARPETRPLWEIETLVLHEAVPGHHLQVARAHELAGLPEFRRFGWYPAFGEGWATYAETLGPEIGFYKDAFAAFGHLNDQLLRAARLVVDTGIHALGWPRQQALDYLNANTANPALDNEVEVDRYIARPGQALAYQIGQLRIQALRAKAQAGLGKDFDERAFHDAVLANGALPLPVLEQEVGRWLAAQAAAKAPPPADSPEPLPKTIPGRN